MTHSPFLHVDVICGFFHHSPNIRCTLMRYLRFSKLVSLHQHLIFRCIPSLVLFRGGGVDEHSLVVGHPLGIWIATRLSLTCSSCSPISSPWLNECELEYSSTPTTMGVSFLLLGRISKSLPLLIQSSVDTTSRICLNVLYPTTYFFVFSYIWETLP